ncbi:MAG: purine-binding chemotaxis protein CheW [Betaproteobacteria bacterium]|nr:purine-binding chemotaxis protein CheW [Betaproteobacteria bacterium]MBI3053915.1 purine-binding chemotaxis protein CheW [Betaproteobacteria bacterium]
MRWVLMTVDGQTYALPLTAVDRILRMVEVTPLPGAPDVVEGVIDIQGEVVAVVSIRRRLGLSHRSVEISDSLVVAHARNRRLAVIAESVLDVVERSGGDVVSTSDIARGTHYIEGLLKTDDGLVLIQDLDKFFSFEEARSLEQAMENA